MHPLRGTTWGPRPLPGLLTEQLAAHGFAPGDAAECAHQLNESPDADTTASLFVDLGSCKFLEGDIDGAVASWRHAITTEHHEPAARALLNLGLLYEHLHLHERAIAVLGSVAEREVDPYVAPAIMAAARCHQSVGDVDVAMESMARLAQSVMAHGADTDELTETLFGLGELASLAGRPDRAERSWRVASAGPESDIQRAATDRLVALLLDQGHDEEILDFLDRHSADVTVAHVPALLERAEALHQLGNTEQAAALVASLNSADLAPNDRFRLADTRRRVGLINEAIDELEVLLNGNDVEVEQRAAFSLGEIYRAHDMVDAASDMYKTALRVGDGFWSPKAALVLGDLSAESGDREGALEHWTYASASSVAAVSAAGSQRLESAFSATAAATTTAITVDEATDPTPAEVVLTKAPEPTFAEAQVVSLGELEAEAPPVVEGQLVLLDGPEVVAVPQRLVEPQVVALNDLEEIAAPPVVEGQLVLLDEPEVVSLNDLDVVDPAETERAQATATNGAEAPTVAGTEPAQTRPADVDVEVVDLIALEAQDASDDSAGPQDLPVVEPVAAQISLVEASRKSTTTSDQKPTASAFRVLSDPNPYAALAPEGHETDVAPSTRNPYAELAPNFDDDFDPGADVQPGDWESMLEDWPRAEPERTKSEPDKKRPSAFSRYT